MTLALTLAIVLTLAGALALVSTRTATAPAPTAAPTFEALVASEPKLQAAQAALETVREAHATTTLRAEQAQERYNVLCQAAAEAESAADEAERLFMETERFAAIAHNSLTATTAVKTARAAYHAARNAAKELRAEAKAAGPQQSPKSFAEQVLRDNGIIN